MLKALPPELASQMNTVSMTYSMEQYLGNDLPAVQEWEVAACASDPNGLAIETIARISLVKGSLLHHDLWSQLDAISGDLEWVGGALLDPDGDLHGDLADSMNGVGSSLLILNSVDVVPGWRGYGVGVYLAGEALLAMDGDAHCVATVPAPMDDSEGEVRQRAIRKLERVWAQLGFEPYRGGAWVLDPGLATLRDAVERMRENFGIG